MHSDLAAAVPPVLSASAFGQQVDTTGTAFADGQQPLRHSHSTTNERSATAYDPANPSTDRGQAFPTHEMVAQMLAQNDQLQKTVTSLVAALVAKSAAPAAQPVAMDAPSTSHLYAHAPPVMSGDAHYASGAWGYASDEQLQAASRWASYYTGGTASDNYYTRQVHGDRGPRAREC